jgi:hypothetical protein
MVKRISPLASNEKFQVRFLVELMCSQLESLSVSRYLAELILSRVVMDDVTAHVLTSQVRFLDGRAASAVLGASGQMVPAFSFRSERSELPNLKARSPDQHRYEALYISSSVTRI